MRLRISGPRFSNQILKNLSGAYEVRRSPTKPYVGKVGIMNPVRGSRSPAIRKRSKRVTSASYETTVNCRQKELKHFTPEA